MAWSHHMATYIWVNIGSGNGLVPSEPMPIIWNNFDISLWKLQQEVFNSTALGCRSWCSLKRVYDMNCSSWSILRLSCIFPYPEPVVFQWQSSGNPVCRELRLQCTLECHWRKNVGSQWSSSGFPVVFQCVPIMQINTGSPLGHHWVLTSASVVPVASQCTCGSSGLPVCSNAN